MAGSPGILEKGLSSFRADLKPAQVVWKEGSKEMIDLKMHSTHFIYGYMASNIW